jgi:hypothetical protein
MVCALTLLVRNGGPDGEPDPQALDEMLAAGGVPALLRITSLSDNTALAVLALLHLIVREPRAEAEVAAADCAGPLVTALGAAFKSPINDVRNRAKADIRAHVVGLISRLVDGRPHLGRALLRAGMLGEVARFLTPAHDVVERKLAMQLTENLIRHTPGACEAMKAEGVLMNLHQLAFGAPQAVGDQTLGTGEGARDMHATGAIPEAESLQARAVLCIAADHCGGLLEVGVVDGEPLRYTVDGVMPLNPETSDASPPPTPLVSDDILLPSPGTPEASATPSPRTPEAAPAPSRGTPEAAAILTPRFPEAASAGAEGPQKLLHPGPGTPEIIPPAPQTSPHGRVRRPSRRVCTMCAVVSQHKLQVCTRCRRAAYCGRECQAAHWPVHKSECRA